MKLNFRSYGHGDSVFILHGLFGSLENWHSISRDLAETYRVVAVDQRNHGQSPYTEEMSYKSMAEDLKELAAEQQLDQLALLGHSMGGKTAMQFALLYPKLVSKLLVVDIAPRVYQPRHLQALTAMLRLDPAEFSSRKQIEEALAREIPDLSLRRFLLKNVRQRPDRQLYWQIGLKEIQRNYDLLREPPSGERPFTGPTLFLRGEKSDFLVDSDTATITRQFPAAKLLTVAGAGHLPHVENPQVFLAITKQFLTTGSAVL